MTKHKKPSAGTTKQAKRKHVKEEKTGAGLIAVVQRHRSARITRSIMMIMIFFSFVSFSTILQLTGSYGGKKTWEMTQERIDFDEVIASAYTDQDFRRVYRMSKDSFNDLHDLLLPQLHSIFFPSNGGCRDPEHNKYLIQTKIRLSIALRFFAGADPLDLFGWHGVSIVSVFVSVWGVIDAVNNTEALAFHFPNHDQQKSVASCFFEKSSAGFDKVIGAIDGILIWTRMPSRVMSMWANVGQSNLRCH